MGTWLACRIDKSADGPGLSRSERPSQTGPGNLAVVVDTARPHQPCHAVAEATVAQQRSPSEACHFAEAAVRVSIKSAALRREYRGTTLPVFIRTNKPPAHACGAIKMCLLASSPFSFTCTSAHVETLLAHEVLFAVLLKVKPSASLSSRTQHSLNQRLLLLRPGLAKPNRSVDATYFL